MLIKLIVVTGMYLCSSVHIMLVFTCEVSTFINITFLFKMLHCISVDYELEINEY